VHIVAVYSVEQCMTIFEDAIVLRSMVAATGPGLRSYCDDSLTINGIFVVTGQTVLILLSDEL